MPLTWNQLGEVDIQTYRFFIPSLTTNGKLSYVFVYIQETYEKGG